MIISYQLGKFAFTEFDENWNEYSHLWKIDEFYKDFPFLPQLNFQEVDNISFEDDRDLYLITFHPKLKREAVGGYVTPDVHPFLKALADNKDTIKTRAYELMDAAKQEEPSRDLMKEFDDYKTAAQATIASLNAEITKLQGDLSTVKTDVSVLKAVKEEPLK